MNCETASDAKPASEPWALIIVATLRCGGQRGILMHRGTESECRARLNAMPANVATSWHDAKSFEAVVGSVAAWERAMGRPLPKKVYGHDA